MRWDFSIMTLHGAYFTLIFYIFYSARQSCQNGWKIFVSIFHFLQARSVDSQWHWNVDHDDVVHFVSVRALFKNIDDSDEFSNEHLFMVTAKWVKNLQVFFVRDNMKNRFDNDDVVALYN